jgi:hypothetical protein
MSQQNWSTLHICARWIFVFCTPGDMKFSSGPGLGRGFYAVNYVPQQLRMSLPLNGEPKERTGANYTLVPGISERSRRAHMAETITSVISVGTNAELVGLRNFVLEEAGFDVISTLDEHDALARIERGECGVLLMCYLVAKPVRQKLANALRKVCPNSRIVLITNEQLGKPEIADTFVYGVEGPEALIEVVGAAVEKVRRAGA